MMQFAGIVFLFFFSVLHNQVPNAVLLFAVCCVAELFIGTSNTLLFDVVVSVCVHTPVVQLVEPWHHNSQNKIVLGNWSLLNAVKVVILFGSFFLSLGGRIRKSDGPDVSHGPQFSHPWSKMSPQVS